MSREVPEGWKDSTVAETCEILDSRRKPLNSEERSSRRGPFPYWGANGIVDCIDGWLFDEPLVLMAEDGGYFAEANERPICHRLDGKAWVNNHAHVIRPTAITRDWFYYWFVHRDITPHIKGGTRSKLNQKDLKQLPILLPPLHEQRRIAEILFSVDQAIAATRAVIEQIRKVKQGVLERLLTKGIGHTRFKQTEIGEIPEGWRIGTLGSIARGLEAGVSVNSENRPKQPGEIGILKTSCVSAGIFDPEEHKTVLQGERDRVKIPVRGDRIIISRMNTPNLVGANGYVENDIGDLFLPDRLWQLSTSENARWLAFLLASDQSRERLSAIATGTSGSMKNISKSKLLDLLFAIPSQAEQQEIASIMQEIDASIEADNRTLKGQLATKSALMSDLLTGRKRVTDALPMAAE